MVNTPTQLTMRFRLERDPDNPLALNSYVNDILRTQYEITEEGLMTVAVEELRKKGYTVIPPEDDENPRP